MPAMILCEPWVQLNCYEIWNVESFWYQLVEPFANPLKPVIVKSGIPGLLNTVSPLKPGIPKFVPALVCALLAKGFSVAVLKKFRPILKSLTRFGVSVWVYPNV